MEALTGVSTALLTIYDMCKALDKSMEISGIYLLHKTGGKAEIFEMKKKEIRIGGEGRTQRQEPGDGKELQIW